MYVGRYNPNLAAADLRCLLRTFKQPTGYELPAEEVDGARRRLEMLNPRELIDVLLTHVGSGIGVYRHMPDEFRQGQPEKPNHGGRFGGSIELADRSL
jgi:hypothetical protein